MPSLENIIVLLQHYGYAILFPIAIIEGPIATVIAGFLVGLGILNVFLVYGIVVFGDGIGDTLCYALGRWGSGLLHRHGHRIGASKEKLDQAKEYFKTRHYKTIIFSKLIHGIGFTGLIAAGALKIPYWRYIRICFVVSALQAAVFLVLGLFFGQAYTHIGKYLDYFAVSVSIGVILVILVIIFGRFKKTSQ